MREHALPQDVIGYKFHIIGNMTLKQFAEVGAGCVAGFLLYSTNLPSFIKWPMILISVGLGAAVAFIPFEERQLDQWVIVFFRALYRPTQFYWKRKPKIPDAFLYKPRDDANQLDLNVDLTPVRRQRVKEYLRSVETPAESDSLEEYGAQRLLEVMSVFQGGTSTSFTPALTMTSGVPLAPQPLAPQPDEVATPQAEPEVVQAPVAEEVEETVEIAPEPPQPTPPLPSTNYSPPTDSITSATAVVKPQPLPQPQQLPELPDNPMEIALPSKQPAQTTNASATLDAQQVLANLPSDLAVPEPITTPLPTTHYPLATSSPTPVAVPESQAVHIQSSIAAPSEVATPTQSFSDSFVESSTVQNTAQTIDYNAMSTITQSQALPFPDPPTDPNKVVGMVLDDHNNSVINAIVEILTPAGIPARAVKTNLLGQFYITTPLSAGTYIVQAEKTGFLPQPQQLTITNQIVMPLEVRVTTATNTPTTTLTPPQTNTLPMPAEIV